MQLTVDSIFYVNQRLLAVISRRRRNLVLSARAMLAPPPAPRPRRTPLVLFVLLHAVLLLLHHVLAFRVLVRPRRHPSLLVSRSPLQHVGALHVPILNDRLGVVDVTARVFRVPPLLLAAHAFLVPPLLLAAVSVAALRARRVLDLPRMDVAVSIERVLRLFFASAKYVVEDICDEGGEPPSLLPPLSRSLFVSVYIGLITYEAQICRKTLMRELLG